MAKEKTKKEGNKWGRAGISAALAVLILVIAFFGAIVNFLTDYLWFKDLGYTSVFMTKLVTQFELGIPSFLILTAVMTLYLRHLRKNYYSKISLPDGESPPDAKSKAPLIISAAFALFVTLTSVTAMWKEILYCFNSTDFGVSDPVFGHDVSFYVFKVALFNNISQILMWLVIGFIGVTVVYYIYLIGKTRPDLFDKSQGSDLVKSSDDQSEEEDDFVEGQVEPEAQGKVFNAGGIFGMEFDMPGDEGLFGVLKDKAKAKKAGGEKPDRTNLKEILGFASSQIIVLGVCFFLVVALNFILRQYDLLYSPTGTVYGAGFTDLHITLWMFRLMAVLAVASAVALAVGVKKKKFKAVIALPVIMIAISFAGTGAASLIQSLIVSPDELNKEYPYLENNITATQQAYDLTAISNKAFPATTTLTSEDVLNNLGTITNIRINDFQPAAQFYNQTQSIRTYYRFNDVDVDRYMVNGEYTQTFLSAREIDEDKVDSTKWLTKHIKYTHGYGITLSRVDKVTASGQPDMLIDSIPPVSDVPEIKITRPEIYFGELTDDYVITNTSEPEFDYPSGSSNVYCEYEGTTGIKLNLVNRVLYAIKERNVKLLVSTNINSNSKILYDRNVLNRVSKIAPFLSYESDPYIVVDDSGKLFWIIDAYTMSSMYPYSTPCYEESDMNYIRNSVKVVVDAYNGNVDFYQIDTEDPIATTIGKIYPKLLKPFSEMPEDLKDNVRYPSALFDIQASVYKRYHMTDVSVFYQSEDVWDIAKETYGTAQQEMTSNYYIMKLPGEQKEEFISSIPYTPKDKNNMTGLLVVRCDGEHYGEMILYSLSKDRTIYGPLQIESQIDQDTDISKEFSLWSSAGSTYTRGNLFVIPIENSLIYVEPIYLEADNESSLPEVKRVIVAYGDKIAYQPTLAEALDEIFGTGTDFAGGGGSSGGGEVTPSDSDDSLQDVIAKANEAFADAESAQKSGDWAEYGRKLDQLKAYLAKLQEITGVPAEMSSGDVMADPGMTEESVNDETADEAI